jgi:hypothetical protein
MMDNRAIRSYSKKLRLYKYERRNYRSMYGRCALVKIARKQLQKAARRVDKMIIIDQLGDLEGNC